MRGTTSRRIVEILKKGKVKRITFASTCPPIKYPCFYGVDFATKQQLIASGKTIQKIKEHLGAFKLVYTTVEDLKSAIRRDICTACLTGNYPEEISKEQKKSLGDQRTREQKTINRATE